MMRKRVKIVIIVLFLTVFISIIIIYFPSFNDKTGQNSDRNVTRPNGRANLPTSQAQIPSSTPTRKSTLTPSPTPEPESPYPLHRSVFATMFWVGEDASEENDYIPNQSSAWDKNWLEHFGGIDTPYARLGYYPKAFVPKENPFYVALPYNDLNDYGRKENAAGIPWVAVVTNDNYSVVKNRWIKVIYKKQVCYGQWEDVGPFETDDFAYVFGNEKPRDKRAGIDLSPALRTCLKMVTNDTVHWQFVDEVTVPDGPWKKIITTTQVNW